MAKVPTIGDNNSCKLQISEGLLVIESEGRVGTGSGNVRLIDQTHM